VSSTASPDAENKIVYSYNCWGWNPDPSDVRLPYWARDCVSCHRDIQ